MRVLSLDQASTTSGYAIFEDGKLETYGHFTFDNMSTGEKLVHIRNRILELVDSYNIDYVIFEDIFLSGSMGNNINTHKVLAEVFGVVDETLTEMNVQHDAVLPSVWRAPLGLGTKGKTRPQQKKAAQEFVLQTFNAKCTQDEADAICIGKYYWTQNDVGFDWT